MGDLDPRCAPGFGKLYEGGNFVHVFAVDDGVHGEAQAEPGNGGRDDALALSSALIAGDTIAGPGVDRLYRELDMVESGLGHCVQHGRLKADAGGDHVGVESGITRMRDELGDIAPQHRLAAGKVDVQHPEGSGFIDQPLPLGSGEFLRAPVEFERVGAIGAAQGTAVGQLGQQAHGRRQCRPGGRGLRERLDIAHRSTIL